MAQSLFQMMQSGPRRKRSDAVLKTYESAIDVRAFSPDPVERSKFIEEVVKGRPGRSYCDKNEGTSAPPGDDPCALRKMKMELKAKDVELDKIHRLFTQASKKLEEMNSIIRENRDFECQLKESQAKLVKMKGDLEELKCSPSVVKKVDVAWDEIKNKDQLLATVTKERNALKGQLCKMIGISEVLRQLKSRADLADQMEDEICRLNRELQRCGGGAAGDSQAGGVCEQCQKLESQLEAEICGNIETEAERNFLRERVRANDVAEAELLIYKAKFEEVENQLKKNQEQLSRSDVNENTCGDLKAKLAEIEENLSKSERHAQELTNIIERQEMDLKERDVYVESLTSRLQKDPVATRAPVVEVPGGKVQSIVAKLSNSPPSNCKCGFDNCECGNVGSSSPNRNKSGSTANSASDLDNAAEDVENKSKSLTSLMAEIEVDEIRLLRQQNAELDEALKQYKAEVEKLTALMSELEQQRVSNTDLEHEKSGLQQQVESIRSSFISSIGQKENECRLLHQQLDEHRQKTCELEEKLQQCHDELCKLRPMESLQETVVNLEEKLSISETDRDQCKKQACDFEGDCVEYRREICNLKNRIEELEFDLEEQRKYAKTLACQLQNRIRMQADKPCGQSQEQSLIKGIKDIRKHYDELKKEKIETIRCYEKKLQEMEEECAKLRCSLSSCDIKEGCKDILTSKLVNYGMHSLNADELTVLHDQVRCAMMRIKKWTVPDQIESPFSVSSPENANKYENYYENMIEELRTKYQLNDVLPWEPNQDEIPVKDTDDKCSSRTLPSLLRSSRKCSSAKNSQRAKSSDGKPEKCVKISRRSAKK